MHNKVLPATSFYNDLFFTTRDTLQESAELKTCKPMPNLVK